MVIWPSKVRGIRFLRNGTVKIKQKGISFLIKQKSLNVWSLNFCRDILDNDFIYICSTISVLFVKIQNLSICF